MFYQWDYGVKVTKEREIRERIQQAQVERLIRSIQPRGEGWAPRWLHSLRHLRHWVLCMSKQLEAMGRKNKLTLEPGTRRDAWSMQPRSE